MSEDRALSRARGLAYRYLAVRPRSRAELSGYLEKKGLPEEVADLVIEELAGQGYIDDRRFAFDYGRYLVETKGLSRYALKMELRKKGVSDEDISLSVNELFDEEGYDEYEVALKAAYKKAAMLSGMTDKKKATRRLTDHLRRRGFGFDIIRRVLKKQHL